MRISGLRIFLHQGFVIKTTIRSLALVWFILLLLIACTLFNKGGPQTYDLGRSYSGNKRQLKSVDTYKEPTTISKYTTDDANSHQYDILINSYQRSGSSFTGQLLAFHPDTFYWYEPVWYYHGLSYLMDRYVCVGNNNCGDFGTKHIDNVHRLLDNIYSCNFTDVHSAVAENMTAQYSGAVWGSYLSCQAQGNPKFLCLKTMEDICKQSKHRATKIVRLTVDNLEHVLDRNDNLKVIHLIRDPRAIINSQITTKWYKMNETAQNDTKLISLKAQDLCIRMKYDLMKGEELKQKYPGRFAFVIFEDILGDLKYSAKELYSYFGIDQRMVERKATHIGGILQEDHKVERKRGNYTNWWRFQLNYRAVKAINQQCKDILTFLGYNIFTSEANLRNESYSAYSLRNELLVSSLNHNNLYDFKALNKRRHYIRKIDIISKNGTPESQGMKLII